MTISEFEIFVLNRYATSELAGALYLGKWARNTGNNYLKAKLTWHCYEEARHAVMWNDLMKDLDIPLLDIHDKGEDEFYALLRKGEIKDVATFLALTHIHELRVPFHFAMHSQYTKNSKIKEVLQQLTKEESSHLTWIRDYLKKEKANGNVDIEKDLKKFYDIGVKEYYNDLIKLENRWPEEAKEFVEIIRKNLPEHEKKMLMAISSI